MESSGAIVENGFTHNSTHILSVVVSSGDTSHGFVQRTIDNLASIDFLQHSMHRTRSKYDNKRIHSPQTTHECTAPRTSGHLYAQRSNTAVRNAQKPDAEASRILLTYTKTELTKSDTAH